MLHGSIRTTQDIDFLVHPDDADRVIERLKRRGYNETQGAWTFRNTQLTLRRVWRKNPKAEDATIVDFLVAGLPRHLNIIKRATVEPWQGRFEIRLATKKDLIWMKSFRRSATDEEDLEFLKNGKLPHDFPS